MSRMLFKLDRYKNGGLVAVASDREEAIEAMMEAYPSWGIEHDDIDLLTSYELDEVVCCVGVVTS